MLLLVALAHAGRGLTVIETPVASEGRLNVRVRIDDDALATGDPELRLVVDGSPLPGGARPASEAGVTTLLSFDASGSFRRHHARAFDLAGALVEARLPGEAVGVMVFGRTARHWEPSSEASAIASSLSEARQQGASQQETRLAAFVREAVDAAARARPGSAGGVRRVVVFTDAGEESGVFPVEEVAEHARSRRVVVDAVVFQRADRRAYAEDLDRVARLVALTGGRVLEVGDADPAADAVHGITTGPSRMWDVHAPWCGAGLPSAGVLGRSGLHADPLPVVGAVAPCAVTPADARPVRAPSDAPRTALPSLDPEDPAGRLLGLACVLLAALGAALVAGVGLLVARRAEAGPRTTEDAVNPSAPPPPPPSTAAPPPAATPSSEEKPSFLLSLPETHLEVVGGLLPPGKRWRFAGRILRVGASPEGNDVVVELPQISSLHARFELFPSGAVFVEDLSSANGTWVERRRLTPGERVEVKAGDRVALSSQLIVSVTRPGANP